MKAERAPQFLSLAARKVCHHHRDLEHLFLEERNAERPLQDGFQSLFISIITYFFLALPAREVRMHEMSLNWAGPDDRDFNDDVIKASRLHARQRRHLR